MANTKKKGFGDARAEYGKEQEGQPFGQYDDEVLAALDAGLVQAETLPIMSIWADKTQPRNIIPREVHGGWTGSPSAMPDILGAWIEAIYDTGADLPIEEILLGKSGGSDKTNSLPLSADPIVAKFLPVLSLASQIRDIGLQQRIGVIALGKADYRIIYGERRWTAYHLLKMFLGDSYSSIPAKVAKVTEWELAKIQAAENFHQNPLNAIGKARQLAKLLLLARKDQQDPPYDNWDALVVEGGCNRPYFAQVADGQIHRIPKGMAEEFERTLNISINQMGQYRSLLRLTGDHEIDNALWNLGDERDWSERFMRDISSLEVTIVRQIFKETEDPEEMLREAVAANNADKKSQNTFTTVKVSDSLTPEEAAPKSPFSPFPTGTATPSKLNFKFGDEVVTPDGAGHIIQTTGNTHLVKLESGPTKRYGDVQLTTAAQGDSWFNKYVQTIAGKVAHVLVDFGADCEIEYADGGRSKIDKEYLSFVDKEEWDNALRAEINRRALDNMVNKYVRTHQGVAKVIRNVDHRTVEVEFPDGDKVIVDKIGLPAVDKAEWDQAVAALTSNQTTETPTLKFKVDDRVTLQKGMSKVSGTIRYIQEDADKPYGVFLEETRSTHYYEEWQLAPWVEDPQWKNAYVRTVTRGVARVTEDWSERYAKLEFPDTDTLTAEKSSLVILDKAVGEAAWNTALQKIHGGRGVDNANSLPLATQSATTPSNNPAPGANDKPREWVGKPASVKVQGSKVPVFVQEFLGSGMLRVVSDAGAFEVHFSELEAVTSDDTTLLDFMDGEDDNEHDNSYLVGMRVLLDTGQIGTVTEVRDNVQLILDYGGASTGSALIDHIVDVLGSDSDEFVRAIRDMDAINMLRHIAHLTGRERSISRLLTLKRQNAIAEYQSEELVPNLQAIREDIKDGFQELIERLDNLLETIITEAEESAD